MSELIERIDAMMDGYAGRYGIDINTSLEVLADVKDALLGVPPAASPTGGGDNMPLPSLKPITDYSSTIARLQAELAEAREVPGRIVDWLRNSGEKSSRKRVTWKGRLFWIATAIQWPENICAGNALGIATAIEARDWSKP